MSNPADNVHRPVRFLRGVHGRSLRGVGIALAWLLAQKPWIVPIPGTTQMAHMLDNIGATEIVFSTDELAALNASLANITIQGERLPPAVQAFSDVEAPLK